MNDVENHAKWKVSQFRTKITNLRLLREIAKLKEKKIDLKIENNCTTNGVYCKRINEYK